MTESPLFPPGTPDIPPPAASNAPEMSVTELSSRLKRTVEDAFSFVRVRGELGRVTVAKSGHMYFDLKDDKSVLHAVMWKGQAAGLKFRPEEGLEVVAEGRLSTFAGKSEYQMIAERLSPAGIGALLAQLEERKRKLMAEGLFDASRKKPIPFLPRVIGVVTSPTGAVIRDILHRLADRFPVHVLVWPVQVQGEAAAGQVSAAIAGFNALPIDGAVPRPDLIIVARGGGSIEDLWAFNEEIVVRAAAASAIPLISAVGHETDTTLIDFASDKRAPTPTAAAEFATPVRLDLLAKLESLGARGAQGLTRRLERARADVRALALAMPKPDRLLSEPQQRYDRAAERLGRALLAHTHALSVRLSRVASRVQPQILTREVRGKVDRLASLAGRLQRRSPLAQITTRQQALDALGQRLQGAVVRAQTQAARKLAASSSLLAALDVRGVLKRGFALVWDDKGNLVRTSASLQAGQTVRLEFGEGQTRATIEEGEGGSGGGEGSKPAPARKRAKASGAPEQDSLF